MRRYFFVNVVQGITRQRSTITSRHEVGQVRLALRGESTQSEEIDPEVFNRLWAQARYAG